MATPAVVQSNKGTSTNSTMPTVAYASNNAAGNLLVAVFQSGGASLPVVSGVTDTLTNTWVRATSVTQSTFTFEIWYAKNCLGGANSVTPTESTAGSSNQLIIYEVSGCDTASPLDQVATGVNTVASTTISTGTTPTTTNASEMVIAGGGDSSVAANTLTLNTTGYTSDQTIAGTTATRNLTAAHLVTTSTGAQNCQWTDSTSVTNQAAIATFKAAGGPSFVQGNQTSGTTNGSSQATISYATQNNAASNLLVASIATLDTVSVTGITDSAGNTWVKAIADVSQTGATKVSTWFVGSCLASSGTAPTFNTLTITTSTISADIGVVIGEWTAAGNAVDVSGTGSGTSNSPSVATSAATSGASELIISAIAAYANTGASTGNTTTQTEEFPTTLDNYASGGTIASGETEAFDGTHDSTLHASAGSGSAQSKISGRSKGPTTGFIQQANTWANLFGIPSNATITAYSVSYDWSCTAATGPSGTPQLQLQTWHNGTAARGGTAVNGTAKTFTGTTAWATATNDINVTGLSEAATQWATFSFQPTMSTAASTSDVVSVNVDHIVITVTYNLPAQAVSFTAGTGWGLRENTSHAATFHADAAIESEVLALAGTATATWTLANQGGWAAQTIAFTTATGPTTYILAVTENVAHAQGWDDAATETEMYFRSTSEPSSPGDVAAAVRTLSRAPSAEVVAFAQGWDASIARTMSAQRATSEAIAFAQGWDASPSRVGLFLRAPTPEAIAFAQGWDASAVSARTFTRTPLENVAFAQGWDASVARAALAMLRVVPTELVSHAQGWDDLLARRASFFRANSEPSLAGDAVAAARSYARSATEAIAHAQGWDETLARRLLAVRSVTEAVAHAAGWDDAGPSVARTQSLAITEAIAHAQGWDDAIITRAYFVRAQTEGGFPADNVERVLLAFRARTENVSAGSGWDASVAFRGSYFRSLVETVAHASGWDDSAVGAKTFLRAITENVGAAQAWDASVARRLSAIRAAIENVAFASGLDATPLAHMLFLRTVSEPSFSADSTVGFKAFFRSVPPETIAFAAGWDAIVSRIATLARSPAPETTFFGDAVARRFTAIRSALETIAIAQGWDATVVGAKTLARALSESVSFASGWDATVARLLLAHRGATEPGLSGDLAALRLLLSRSIVENVAVSQGWDASAVGFRGFVRSTTENVAAAQAWDATVARFLFVHRVAAETSLVADALSVRQLLARQVTEAVGSARGWEAVAAASLLRVLSVPSEPSLSADAVGLALLRIRAIMESSVSGDATSVSLLLLRSLLETIAASRGWDAIVSALFIPSHQPFIVPAGRVIRGEDGTLVMTGEPSPLHLRSEVEWPFVVTGEPSPLDVRSGYAEALREDV